MIPSTDLKILTYSVIRTILLENSNSFIFTLPDLLDLEEGDTVRFANGDIYTLEIIRQNSADPDKSVTKGSLKDRNGRIKEDIYTLSFEDLLEQEPVPYGDTKAKFKHRKREEVQDVPIVQTEDKVHKPYTRKELKALLVGDTLMDPFKLTTLLVLEVTDSGLVVQIFRHNKPQGIPEEKSFAFLTQQKYGRFVNPEEVSVRTKRFSDLPYGKYFNLYTVILDQFLEPSVYNALQRAGRMGKSGTDIVARTGDQIINKLIEIDDLYVKQDLEFFPDLSNMKNSILSSVRKSFTVAHALGALIKGIFKASPVYNGTVVKVTQAVDNIVRTSKVPFDGLLNYLTQSNLSTQGLTASTKKVDKFQKGDEFDNYLDTMKNPNTSSTATDSLYDF